ncbi:VP1 [Scorpion polyomavirus 1]|nr:VP1 [Scorpion polyomavirus 1]
MTEYTLGPVQWTVYGNRMCNYEILKPDNNPCHRIYCLTYIQGGGDSRIRIKKLTIQHPDDYWCSPSSCNKPKNFKGNKCTETSNKMLRWEIFAANVEERWVVPDDVGLHQPYYHSWAIGNSELVLAEYDTTEAKRAQIERFVVESNPGEYDWTDPEDRSFYIYQQNQFSMETAYPTNMQNAPPPGETSLSNAYQIVTDEDKIGIILFKPEITLGHAFYCSGGTPAMNVKFKLYMRPRLICVQPLLTMLLANQGAMNDLPPIPSFEHVVPVVRGLKKYPDNPPAKPATPCVVVCQAPPPNAQLTDSSLQTNGMRAGPPPCYPEKEQEMEVDREKQKNILEVIGETTQSDTVPRPISPSEVPNGPSVDPSSETRGNDDEEDDIDGLLTFDKIYFAYNIYTDMFKEPDSLESFTNYIRRNAKLDRVAEKMVDAYKNKKKLK